MSDITKETRFESYITTPTKKRKQMILDVLTEPMTARQIMNKLSLTEPNQVRPRLSELKKSGKIEAFNKAEDEITGKQVAVYRRIG